jgi:hypothetical protein
LAAGFTTTASGTSSTALGYLTHATGFVSTALGLNTTASGDYSTTMGRITTASGDYSTASGYNNVASGDYSTALGRDVSTNNFAGCLAIGDASGLGVTNCVRVNELRARFAGGYALYTSGVGISGVFMLNGANAWSSISDSTKKENFLPVDGGYVINCIEKMKLGSWNYKQQDKKIFRHYGPMAQEFYSAFGNDGIGKIGCDTLINSADIDGVMMIGLQALAKRSNSLEAENKILRENNIVFQEEINRIKNVNAKMNQATEDKIALLEKQVSMLIAASENKITGATITVK